MITAKDIRSFSESSHNGRDGKKNKKADAGVTPNHGYWLRTVQVVELVDAHRFAHSIATIDEKAGMSAASLARQPFDDDLRGEEPFAPGLFVRLYGLNVST